MALGQGFDAVVNSERRFWFLALLLFTVAATLLYWPAQGGGWYLDDKPAIPFNAALHSLASPGRLLSASRGPSLFTFALNWALWGDTPAAFRWVNVALHLFNSLLVIALIRQLTDCRRWPAFLVGLLFLCHPVQTAAVSYIVQRAALLSAGFALSALLLLDRYFLLRLAGDAKRARLFLLGALGCGILSPLAKENTILLPLAFLLLAWYRGRPGLVAGWQPALAASALIPLLPLLIHSRRLFASGLTLSQVGETIFFSDSGAPYYRLLVDRSLLPWRYLLAQLEVFWVYLGLILLPLRQALDYSWPIPDATPRLLHVGTALLLGALLLLVFSYRQRFPLSFFGTLWIILFMAIESSFLPLDPIFVHRLYLPLVGVLLILHEQLLCRWPQGGIRVLLLLVALFSILTWQRNTFWGNPVAFWEENTTLVPRAFRPRIHLAVELFAAGRFREAAEVQKAFAAGAAEASPYRLLGEAYYFADNQAAAQQAFALAEAIAPATAPSSLFAAHRALSEGQVDAAEQLLGQAEQKEGNNVFGLYLRGQLAERRGDRLAALSYYQQVNDAVTTQFFTSAGISFDATYNAWAKARRKVLGDELAGWLAGERARFATAAEGIAARTRWANQLLLFDCFEEAITEYCQVVAQAPALWQGHFNLGMAYDKIGARTLAIESYREGLRLAPDNPTILLNYGIALKEEGHYRQAAEVLERLLIQTGNDGRVWIVYGAVQEGLGDRQKASEAYAAAAQLPGFRGEAMGLLEHLKRRADARQ